MDFAVLIGTMLDVPPKAVLAPDSRHRLILILIPEIAWWFADKKS